MGGAGKTRRKWLWRTGGALATLALALAVAHLTGQPHTALLERALARAFMARVDIVGFALLPIPRIERAVVGDRDAGVPLATFEDIVMRPGSIRRVVAEVTISRAEIRAIGAEAEQTNFDFLKDFFARPSTGPPPLRFLPQSIRVDDFSAAVQTPARSARLTDATLTAAVTHTSEINVRMRGDAARLVAVAGADQPEQLWGPGRLDIQLELGPREVRVDFEAGFGDGVDVKGAYFSMARGMGISRLIIERGRLHGERLAPFLPYPVRFEELDLGGTNLLGFVARSDVALGESDIVVAAKGLSVGETDRPWYEGDLTVRGQAELDAIRFEAQLNRGQRVAVVASSRPGPKRFAATLVDWTREDLVAATPPHWRFVLDDVPHLRFVSGGVEGQWSPNAYHFTASLEPVFAAGASGRETFSISAEGRGARERGPMLDGGLEVRLAGGRVSVKAVVMDSENLDATVELTGLDSRRWLRALTPSLAVEGVEADLAGTAKVTQRPDQTSAAFDLVAKKAKGFGLEAPADVRIDLDGTIFRRREATATEFRNLRFAIGEDAVLTVSEGAYLSGPPALVAEVAGRLDLDVIAPQFQLGPYTGVAEVRGPLRLENDRLTGTLRFAGDGFGYGAFSTPFGVPVTLEGRVNVNTRTWDSRLIQVSGAWGDGTRLTTPEIAIDGDPFVLSSVIEVQSDLRPLVDLGLIDSGVGTGAVQGLFALGDPDPRSDLKLDLAASHLVLKDALAALGGLALQFTFESIRGLRGTGRARAVDIAAAGAVFNDSLGTFTMDEGRVKTSDTTGSLYGGRMRIEEAEIDLFGGTGAGRLRARIEDVDLDRFTKEYEPPAVKLTGLADGLVDLEWNSDGLTAFDLELESTRDFTLNRETIEQLLMTSFMGDVRGLKFLNRRIRKKTIGEAAQRRFDRAAVALRLVGDTYETQRLEGPVVLDSDTLDFTIDLRVDVRALADALKLQQEAQLENIDSISAEPLKWSTPAGPTE